MKKIPVIDYLYKNYLPFNTAYADAVITNNGKSNRIEPIQYDQNIPISILRLNWMLHDENPVKPYSFQFIFLREKEKRKKKKWKQTMFCWTDRIKSYTKNVFYTFLRLVRLGEHICMYFQFYIMGSPTSTFIQPAGNIVHIQMRLCCVKMPMKIGLEGKLLP